MSSMLMPVVSIIVPNYNHAAFLRDRLESIVHQTYQNYEIILLDDHSTDGSVDILQQYSTHLKVSHFIVNEENSGNPFIQWQRGLELAQGEYIWIAESDDVADLTFLEMQLNKLVQVAEAGMSFCKSLNIDSYGTVLSSEVRTPKKYEAIWEQDFRFSEHPELTQYLAVKCLVPNASAVLFKKSALMNSTWSPAEFRYINDWKAWILIAGKYDVLFVSKPLNKYRSHSGTTRSRRFTYQYIEEEYRLACWLLSVNKTSKNEARIKCERLVNRLINVLGYWNSLVSRKFWGACYTMHLLDSKFSFLLLRAYAVRILRRVKK